MNFIPATRFLGGLLAVAAVLAAGRQKISGQTPPKPPAEEWFARGAQFPAFISTNQLRVEFFESLRGEALAGRFKVIWPGAETNLSVALWSSTDTPGHWPARDWRSQPMSRAGGRWETSPPVDSLDVPLLYFVVARGNSATNVSPMHLFRPRIAGLEESTRIFSPFLEGFEENLESWRLAVSGDTPALRTDAAAQHGRAALNVALPANSTSVTVATTRVRGWLVDEHFASGLSLWLRTKAGEGRARFTLHAHAFSPDQIISTATNVTALNPEWQKVELPFNAFPKLPVSEIDLFTIEFIGNGPQEFLVDDLQLLGRWKLPLE